MNRPVLGIIACTRQLNGELAQAVMERYVRSAIKYADAAALIIPSLPDLMSASEVAPRLDGILLTGSLSNVEPGRYGEAEGDGPFDPQRDEMVMALSRAMIGRAKPVFGICRGFQELNVALGGTLRRDTSANAALLAHHAPDGADLDGMFAHRHEVRLVEGGVLATAYTRPELEVNSVHYQGIRELAPGLAVEATAPDGLIEAYSARPNGATVLAVQWHPEWATDEEPESQVFFKLLGRALRGEALA